MVHGLGDSGLGFMVLRVCRGFRALGYLGFVFTYFRHPGSKDKRSFGSYNPWTIVSFKEFRALSFHRC